jgi:hypothetical protein
MTTRDNPFYGPASILWVCDTAAIATARWLELGKPQNVMMTSVGSALCGSRYSEIIVELLGLPQTATQQMRMDDWMAQLPCRLLPGKEVRYLR